MQHHVIHRHVDQMLNAANVMELELVIAMKDLKAMPMIRIGDVDVNVNWTMTVTIACHVFDSSVSIHVLAFAELWPCVMCQDMFQHVLVQQAWLVIHSSNAVKYQRRRHLDKMNTHAVHHHAELIVIAAIIWVKQFVRVSRAISVHHHIVDQNV